MINKKSLLLFRLTLLLYNKYIESDTGRYLSILVIAIIGDLMCHNNDLAIRSHYITRGHIRDTVVE